MKEVIGNIWDFHTKGGWVVITTNGTIKKNGEAVMGRGIALQAKQRFPNLSYELGQRIKVRGNYPEIFPEYHLLTLPVKHQWFEKADILLIEHSLPHLLKLVEADETVYLVRPGCGNGGLDWAEVRPILERYLDDKFIVVNCDEEA